MVCYGGNYTRNRKCIIIIIITLCLVDEFIPMGACSFILGTTPSTMALLYLFILVCTVAGMPLQVEQMELVGDVLSTVKSMECLTVIRTGTFQDVPTFVREVKIYFTYLNVFEKAALDDLYFITRLNLSENGITSLCPCMFQNLSKLQTLDQSNNFIQFISADAFNGLPALVSLEIVSNQIRKIHPMALSPLHSLESLNFKFNKLKEMDRSHIMNLHHLQKLNVALNGFKSVWINEHPRSIIFGSSSANASQKPWQQMIQYKCPCKSQVRYLFMQRVWLIVSPSICRSHCS